MRLKGIRDIRFIMRVIAFVLSLCFVFVLLLSTGGINLVHSASAAHQHEHEHSGATADNDCADCCSTCLHMGSVKTLLKYLAVAVFAALIAALMFTGMSAKYAPHTIFSTPVSMKLRMNN